MWSSSLQWPGLLVRANKEKDSHMYSWGWLIVITYYTYSSLSFHLYRFSLLLCYLVVCHLRCCIKQCILICLKLRELFSVQFLKTFVFLFIVRFNSFLRLKKRLIKRFLIKCFFYQAKNVTCITKRKNKLGHVIHSAKKQSLMNVNKNCVKVLFGTKLLWML